VNIAEAELTILGEALCSETKQWKKAIEQKLSAHRKNKTWFYSRES